MHFMLTHINAVTVGHASESHWLLHYTQSGQSELRLTIEQFVLGWLISVHGWQTTFSESGYAEVWEKI